MVTERHENPNRDVTPTGSSRQAILHSVPIQAVTLGDGFWRPRVATSCQVGLPAFLSWLERDDQTAPFPAYSQANSPTKATAIRAGLETLRQNYAGQNKERLPHHWRANLMAWMEACAFSLHSVPDPAVGDRLEHFVTGVVAAHKDAEFLDVYYGEEFQYAYQLANPAHLIQAAIAHAHATASTQFLDCARGVAERVGARFLGEKYAEHPAIEMALVDLYRTTDDEAYLNAARHFLDPLLNQPAVIGPNTSDTPYRERHVVRQTYLCAGGADYLMETGDPRFREQLEAIWQDMSSSKLQITGQLAVSPKNPEMITEESFALSAGVFGSLRGTWNLGFELCEAVGNIAWNWRMLSSTGDAKYADLMERTLYNGFLAHVSLDGGLFYYLSPLSSDGDHSPRTIWGHPETSCCPPNAMRLLASLPGYFFSTSEGGLWVHLYDNCRLDWQLEDGMPFTLIQRTAYPWNGHVDLELRLEQPATFALWLRIPNWCYRPAVLVNGSPIQGAVDSGTYCQLRRRWQNGDTVTLNLPMPVLGMGADHRAADFRGKTALMRGPLVYCFEGIDNPGLDVWDIELACDLEADDPASSGLYQPLGELGEFVPVQEELLGGIVALRGLNSRGSARRIAVTAIPYYAWANREPSPMRVWVGDNSGITSAI